MGANELLTLPQAPPVDQVPPEIRETVGRYRVDLEDGRSFMLILSHGRLYVDDAKGGADCVLSCSMETFRGVLKGEKNLLTAFMRSEAVMSGDLASAKRLHQYLRLIRARGATP